MTDLFETLKILSKELSVRCAVNPATREIQLIKNELSYRIRVHIRVPTRDQMVLSAGIPFLIPRQERHRVLDLLTHMNRELTDGSFELNTMTGEVSFKTFWNTDFGQMNLDVLLSLVSRAALCAHTNAKYIFALITHMDYGVLQLILRTSSSGQLPELPGCASRKKEECRFHHEGSCLGSGEGILVDTPDGSSIPCPHQVWRQCPTFSEEFEQGAAMFPVDLLLIAPLHQQESWRTLIDERGYTCLAAEDGIQALGYLRDGVRPSAVVCASDLPGLSADMTLQQIRLLYPEVSVEVVDGDKVEHNVLNAVRHPIESSNESQEDDDQAK